MNILVIGNGFDLAHGLPTTYKDFLRFTQAYEKYRKLCISRANLQEEEEKTDDTNRNFLKYFIKTYDENNIIFEQLNDLISENLWLKHFYNVQMKQGWIDFECEISRIVQTLDSVRIQVLKGKEKGDLLTHVPKYQIETLKGFSVDSTAIESITFVKKTKKRLLDDLNRLIRCLEIYLSDYVENIPVLKKHLDIQEINADYVLSFNYTNTYERLYEDRTTKIIEYDYIHGKANLMHDVDECNMVLGIDEYLNDWSKDMDNEFIQFKKFFQRIYKKTGCQYIDWLKELGYITDMEIDGWEPIINIYIFGHSLDVTDKDILARLILKDGAKTTIFYHNKKALESQIANLVKVIGQDELIARVHGGDATIEFVEQQE